MSSGYQCPLCSKKILDVEFDDHVADEHANVQSLDLGAGSIDITDLKNHSNPAIVDSDLSATTSRIPKPHDVMYSLGLSSDGLRRATAEVTGTAGSINHTEMLMFYSRVNDLIGHEYTFDRSVFTVSLIRYLVETDASDKFEDSGTIRILKQSTVGAGTDVEQHDVTFKDLVEELQMTKSDSNHTVTARRIARFLGPTIMDLVTKGTVFSDLNAHGTSVSQRLGVPNKYWYTCLSFFPAMKDPGTWSKSEIEYNNFKNKNSNVDAAGSAPTALGDKRPGAAAGFISSQDYQRFETEILANHRGLTPTKVNEIFFRTLGQTLQEPQRVSNQWGIGYGK